MRTLHHPDVDGEVTVPDSTARVLEKSGWKDAPKSSKSTSTSSSSKTSDTK